MLTLAPYNAPWYLLGMFDWIHVARSRPGTVSQMPFEAYPFLTSSCRQVYFTERLGSELSTDTLVKHGGNGQDKFITPVISTLNKTVGWYKPTETAIPKVRFIPLKEIQVVCNGGIRTGGTMGGDGKMTAGNVSAVTLTVTATLVSGDKVTVPLEDNPPHPTLGDTETTVDTCEFESLFKSTETRRQLKPK